MSDLSERLRLDSFRFALEESRGEGSTDTDLATMAYERADRAALASPGRPSWACAKGCAACCHLKVHITRAEAVAIASHLEASLSPGKLAALRRTLADRAEAGRGLGPGPWRKAAIPCGLLADDRTCRIYDERPVPCRIHVSPSAADCEDPDAVVFLDRWLVLVGQALQRGLGPEEPQELHAALLEVLGSS